MRSKLHGRLLAGTGGGAGGDGAEASSIDVEDDESSFGIRDDWDSWDSTNVADFGPNVSGDDEGDWKGNMAKDSNRKTTVDSNKKTTVAEKTIVSQDVSGPKTSLWTFWNISQTNQRNRP